MKTQTDTQTEKEVKVERKSLWGDDLPPMFEELKKFILFPYPFILGMNNTYIIYEFKGDDFYIDLITTDPDHRGKGETSYIMNYICEVADLTNTTISLVPDDTFSQSGFGFFETPLQRVRNHFYKMASKRKGKLTMKRLVMWYERLGFVKEEDSDRMVRKPKGLGS
jgi:GNAT superfamily N-acetyltransferase